MAETDSPQDLFANGNEVIIPELVRPLWEQAQSLRRALTEARLVANGFTADDRLLTRREIFEDLRPPNRLFAPGYRPTLYEVLDKSIGRDNWTAIPTDEVSDRRDPWHQETPDITEWQNTKYHLFTRPKEAGDRDGAVSASEIEKSVLQQYPEIHAYMIDLRTDSSPSQQ